MRSPWARKIDDIPTKTFTGRIKLLGEEAMGASRFVKESDRDPAGNSADGYYAPARIAGRGPKW